jgi:hypothetical protein
MVGDCQIHADLDVLDNAGRLQLRVKGWEDLRVDLPHAFYRMCISPRGVYLSSARKVDAQAAVCSIDTTAVPSLTAHGGIWLRALAHILLSRREREEWRGLAVPDGQRIEWLLGRCCAKDAVRLLARERGQPDLLPADVPIVPDVAGRPSVAGGSIRPVISISHADGVAVAAATMAAGTAVGVD